MGAVDDLRAALDEFGVQRLDIADPEEGVEHVRGDDLAVRRAPTPGKHTRWMWQPSRRAYP